ncbi:MAG: MoaD/ThiS family protein [Dehalococcoidia bacterium]
MSSSASPGSRNITVRVVLHADLRRFRPDGSGGPLELELPPEASVADLLARLNVPDSEMLTVGLNGELGAADSILAAGDEVTLFSPMEGG